MTEALKKYFVELYDIHTKVFEDDIFEYQLKQYNKYTLYTSFKKFIKENYKTVDDFLKEKNIFIDKIFEYFILNKRYFIFAYLNDIRANAFFMMLKRENKLNDFWREIEKIYDRENIKQKIDDILFKTKHITRISKRNKEVNRLIYKSKTIQDFFNILYENENIKLYFDFVKENNIYDNNFFDVEKIKNIITNDNIINTKIIEIDLSKANFSVLYYLNIVEQKYDDFIRQFSNNYFIIRNKHLRQVLIGNLSHSRIESVMKIILYDVYHNLKNHYLQDVFVVSHDSLIIKQNYSNILLKILEKFEYDFNISFFEINLFDTNYGRIFYKEILKKLQKRNNNTFIINDYHYNKELIGVNNKFYIQAYKILYGKKINKKDLFFTETDTHKLASYYQKMEKI
jgi:hypothetical protein